MLTREVTSCRVVLWGVVLAIALTITLAPTMLPAQEESPAMPDTATATAADSLPEFSPNTNPTQRLIYPRKHQSTEQQQSDQSACYDWTCDQIDWDPYQAYADLAAEGYVVALTRQEMERGLICLAEQGAVTGAIAGDLVGDPELRPELGPEFEAYPGSEIGAAIAIAVGLVQAGYLIQANDPEAQRAVEWFERNLRKWDRKYAACLSRKGYQVPPQ